MELPDDVRHTLANEFKFAAEQMDRATDFSTMLYFYSAFYGAVFRALNLAWSDELALMHLVLRTTHQEMNQLAETTIRGQRFVGIPENLLQVLSATCAELANMFEANRTDDATLYPLLTKIAKISYSTNGNGRYLHIKEALKI